MIINNSVGILQTTNVSIALKISGCIENIAIDFYDDHDNIA